MEVVDKQKKKRQYWSRFIFSIAFDFLSVIPYPWKLTFFSIFIISIYIWKIDTFVFLVGRDCTLRRRQLYAIANFFILYCMQCLPECYRGPQSAGCFNYQRYSHYPRMQPRFSTRAFCALSVSILQLYRAGIILFYELVLQVAIVQYRGKWNMRSAGHHLSCIPEMKAAGNYDTLYIVDLKGIRIVTGVISRMSCMSTRKDICYKKKRRVKEKRAGGEFNFMIGRKSVDFRVFISKVT